MAISPQKQRELLFLLLYSADFGSDEEVFKLVMTELCVSRKSVVEAMAIKEKMLAKREDLDLRITEYSKEYALDRIPAVERNILRVCIYELLYSESVPAKVAIAEAIRLTKKFATPEAITFVNAVVDGIYQDLLALQHV